MLQDYGEKDSSEIIRTILLIVAAIYDKHVKGESQMLQELYEQYKDTFSKSDHKLIQYLLRNEEQLQYLTSEELSAHTGISPATVSRFWKKIGFQNLKELKIKQRIQDTQGVC